MTDWFVASNSREAHQKQKALAKERKNAKPNADVIERSKKLWEKLRLKSHIEKDERKELVKELFDIITGRVKDFVFKHDSVRVIQTAIKYSTMEQRRMIARELKGEFKVLSEGKYSKFLIAKLVEKGDPEIRDLIITEFYGHVKRMINHPEAAWIMDDIYRAVATPEQKNRMLREWYGAEFSIQGLGPQGTESADLAKILEESPEKRKPIMGYLENQINSLIQKKLNGFTMLHDAMLQYFLVCEPGTEQANDFLDHLKPDPTLKEGEEADNVDLMKNLAFTKSGSRLVSLCFAYGTAKDRKLFLRPYKDTIEIMAFDQYAHHVLLAALAVTDDTLHTVGWNTIGGRRLWLAGDDGTEFYYAHLQGFAPAAVAGARVRAGDVLGFVGTSGDARGTPPHLHFEVHPGGQMYGGQVDPVPWLRARGVVMDRCC